jgi:hypothetical protein
MQREQEVYRHAEWKKTQSKSRRIGALTKSGGGGAASMCIENLRASRFIFSSLFFPAPRGDCVYAI